MGQYQTFQLKKDGSVTPYGDATERDDAISQVSTLWFPAVAIELDTDTVAACSPSVPVNLNGLNTQHLPERLKHATWSRSEATSVVDPRSEGAVVQARLRVFGSLLIGVAFVFWLIGVVVALGTDGGCPNGYDCAPPSSEVRVVWIVLLSASMMTMATIGYVARGVAVLLE
jgi:hypothetical protein